MKPLTVYLLAVKHFKPEHQKKKAIEEMGELTTELCREQDGRTTPKKVITEIADVLITVRQLAIIYGMEAVTDEIRRKERRLMRRIAKETKESNGNG